jgi:hypothetical protein
MIEKSCCNLLAPVRQLSLNSRSARMSFSQVQRVFIVEHYLASHSYLTCQNEFTDTFPYYPMPNKSAGSRLLNRFRDTGRVQYRNCSGRPSTIVWTISVKLCHALHENHWENFLFRVDYPTEAYIRLQKLHPYRVHIMYKLKEPDKEKRL